MDRKTNPTINFFFILSLILGATNFLPSIVAILFWTFTAVMILSVYGSKVLRRKSVLLFLLYYIVVVVYALLGHGAESSLRGHVSQILGTFSILVFSYYVCNMSYGELRKGLFVFLVALFISVIGTTYVSTIDPDALRYYGAEGREETSLGLYYRMLGMMSYSQSHALAILIPPLILLLFSSRKMKLAGAVLILLIIRILFVMEVTTALLATILASIIVLLNINIKGSWKKVVFVSIIFIGVLYLGGAFSAVWNMIGSAEDVDVAVKLASFSTLEGGQAEGDLGGRIILYSVSLQTFLANPIFGWGVDNGSYTVIGEHSFLLDLLAYYGLFALLIFIAWLKEYKSIDGVLWGKLKSCYHLCLIPLVILVVSKSRFAYIEYLFMSLVIVRMIYLYIANIHSFKETHLKI